VTTCVHTCPCSCDWYALGYVFEAITLTRHELKGKVPLIGFCGAPVCIAMKHMHTFANRTALHLFSYTQFW
jgi:uroporphyrinogen-III decarboxylase